MNTIAAHLTRITRPDTCSMLDNPDDYRLVLDDQRTAHQHLRDTRRTLNGLIGRTTKARAAARAEKRNAATLPPVIATGHVLRKATK